MMKRLSLLPMGNTVRGFLNHLTVEAGLSVNTVLAYGRDLKAFLEYCSQREIANIAQNCSCLRRIRKPNHYAFKQ